MPNGVRMYTINTVESRDSASNWNLVSIFSKWQYHCQQPMHKISIISQLQENHEKNNNHKQLCTEHTLYTEYLQFCWATTHTLLN